MSETAKSRVVLVGAGPGAADLLTVRAVETLKRADVLLYDGLVAPEVVALCPAAERHFVGKSGQDDHAAQPGAEGLSGARLDHAHPLSQPQITALLVALATRPGPARLIVRLKGGDPFVFGRGGEEALACVAAGVPVSVVPGVTAGLAAPGLAGLPVTHRGLSRGVTLLTGHQKEGEPLTYDWDALVGTGTTLVFYMAVASLPRIVEGLTAAGMPPGTPCLAIERATTARERVVEGVLATFHETASAAQLQAPAVIVIGEVVSLWPQLGRPAA